ncbi:MAG: glutamate-5-semialdehyde dehydrogenase [Campylobacter sp.]|nr:glutamate-5-semialdehyde dehydrogenase [Campylobacter sp.]
MTEIESIAKKAKKASLEMAKLSSKAKNSILKAVANELLIQSEFIKTQNLQDIQNAKQNGISSALIDRLTLNDARIKSMSDSLLQLANFADPIGEIVTGWRHENGLGIEAVRVPLGVIAMIYESRPNVSIDASALALKSGNAIILRGSSNALYSNKALIKIFNETGAKFGLVQNGISLITTPDRTALDELIKQDKFIDVLIPRGGKNLKEYIKQNAKIPFIETGAGVCHIYVDESAKLKDSVNIIKNAKTQRPSVCNALECLVLNEKIVDKILPLLLDEMRGTEFRIDAKIYDKFSKFDNAKKADENDFGCEFLDLILAVKVVRDLDSAIEFINEHSSTHSESILTQNSENIEKFLAEVNSAVVYANASTRFSDGGEFGFGGEIGISTQKLHARGPMGVRALTSIKYIVRGNGQIRE